MIRHNPLFRFTMLGVQLCVASLFAAAPSFAQASDNPNSDYAVCHGGSPPAWCDNTCGDPDVWCEFAGYRCYMDNTYFDMIPGVKNHELLMEEYSDDGGQTMYWLDDGDDAEAQAWAEDLAIQECVDEGTYDEATCTIIVEADNDPNCSTQGNGWEDWHCEVAQSSTVCLERGI